MRIELHNVSIRDVFEGYKDSQEEGVIGYGGRLNIRPKYQREFVYKDTQRDAVIDTVRKGFPLNVMYWVKSDKNTYELLDGQQRTVSICQYLRGDFSIENKYFHSLAADEKEQILNYKLMIYFCDGSESEKLAWFRTVNIAGEKLTDQELRNAVYAGSWTTDAKRYFSKTGCAAYGLAGDYLKGSPIRQEYLETAVRWLASSEEDTIEGYMSRHQHDETATDLWLYFQKVISWIKLHFPNYRKEMKGVEWGLLYNCFKDAALDPLELEKQISSLMLDEDVTRKTGIYEYLLDGDERHLSIRNFTPNMKREAYERQSGICIKCGEQFELADMEADHITPWHEGGRTTSDNCQMLCKDCNRRKSGK